MLVSRTLSQGAVAPVAAACSAVAAFAGDEFITNPVAPRLEVCVRRGVDLWYALRNTTARHVRSADHRPPSYLAPTDVLAATVDTATGELRWTVVAEWYGAHTVAAPTGSVLEQLAAVGDEIAVASLEEALDRVVRRAEGDERRSLAAAITFAGHTVVFAVAYDHWASEYHAFDSLRGEWARGDDAREVISLVTTRWCPRVAETPAFSATKTPLATFNSPGMFSVVVFARRRT